MQIKKIQKFKNLRIFFHIFFKEKEQMSKVPYSSVVESLIYAMMKISVSTDISVLGFYGYIGDISVDIFT